jgi:hypothetical protein
MSVRRMTTVSLLVTQMLLAACQPVRPVAPDPVATITAAGAPRVLTPLASHDGRWQAEVAAYPCTPVGDDGDLAYEQLTLIQLASGRKTVVATQTIACGGLGAFGLAGLFWSADSRYFYFTAGREGVPDGCGNWQPPITRLDVANFATTELGGGALSPSRTRLATWEGRSLAIWDMEHGDALRVTAAQNDLPIGPVAWSPDGQALVYIQVASHCPLMGVSVLVRLDLPRATQTVLLESATPTFGSVAWDDPDSLTLTDAAGAAWRFDLATGELTAAP